MPKSSPLDDKLLQKIADKQKKQDTLSVRKAVSARASRYHISPQAALVIMAHELGVRTAVYERSLNPGVQEQIRSHSGLKGQIPSAPLVRYKTVTRKHAVNNDKNQKRPWWENPLFLLGLGIPSALLVAYLVYRLGWN